MPNSTSEYSFTIIIPIFNEEEMIPELIQQLSGFLESAPVKSCVLFVNDGSTDSSASLISNACSSRQDFFFIEFERNSGLSAALKAGFDYCCSELCGYMDADLQTDPEDFKRLLALIDDNLMVTGIRTHRDDGQSRRFQSKIANGFRCIMTGDGAKDSCCPLKVFRTEAARRIPLFKGMHRFFPALILLQEGGRYAQIPVSHHKRTGGQSKFGLWNRLPGALIDCFVFRWMSSRYIRYRISSSKL